MERVKTQIRFQYLDAKKPFLTFWGIIILVNVLGYFVNIKFGNTYVGIKINNQLSVVWSNNISIGIFLIVSGILMYTETFNSAIEFGSTRKDFYKGSIIFYVLISLAMIIVQAILLQLESIFASIAGFSVYLGGNFSLIKLFFIFLLICSVSNLLGTLIYKFNYWLWICSFIAILGFTLIEVLRNGIVKLFYLIVVDSTLLFSINLAILSLICFLIGWLLIRKNDIKNKM